MNENDFHYERGGKKFGKMLLVLITFCALLASSIPILTNLKLVSEGLAEKLTMNEMGIGFIVFFTLYNIIAVPVFIVFVKKNGKWKYFIENNVLHCETPTGRNRRVNFKVLISEIESIKSKSPYIIVLNNGEWLQIPTILEPRSNNLFEVLLKQNAHINFKKGFSPNHALKRTE